MVGVNTGFNNKSRNLLLEELKNLDLEEKVLDMV
jgi:hypothetical protein